AMEAGNASRTFTAVTIKAVNRLIQTACHVPELPNSTYSQARKLNDSGRMCGHCQPNDRLDSSNGMNGNPIIMNNRMNKVVFNKNGFLFINPTPSLHSSVC